jgi:hypothetical protein
MAATAARCCPASEPGRVWLVTCVTQTPLQ